MLVNSLKFRIIFSITGIVVVSLVISALNFGQKAELELSDLLEDNALLMMQQTTDHVDSQYQSILYHRDVIVSRRKTEIKNIVTIADAFIRNAYGQYIKGEISEDRARESVMNEFREIRYDNEIGYFWISDTTSPFPRMIMHPTSPELEGLIMDNPDFNSALGRNENLFKAFVDVSLEQGGGYVDYYWPKPLGEELTETQPKISYVKLFEPWNWILGTGVYIDDIEKDVQDRIDAVIEDLNRINAKQRDSESGYFFIFNENLDLLVHPYLAGENGSEIINPGTGSRLLDDFKNITYSEDHYLEYLWDKPESEGEYRFRKKAYVTFFEPLGWYIGITLYLEDSEQRIEQLVNKMILFASWFILIALIISLLVSKSITIPLDRLVLAISKTDQNGIPLGHIPSAGSSEIKVLSLTINRMIESIRKSNSELVGHKEHLEELVEERTAELKKSLDQLTMTQKQLVESEKMASLGGLVAGVAHEINTPVGIGVTTASFLEEKTGIFAEEYKSGKLTRKDFEKYIDAALTSAGLILSNLKRASELVHSFKQVAVDQSSEDRRQFKIREYVDEVLISLHPEYVNTNHQVEVVCSEDFTVNSFPGALSQIITNLLVNSLKHGFEDDDHGLVEIEILKNEVNAKIIYKDSGRGIPEENIVKIFEPFFTTERGKGGSGLGMHIVYNLVTQSLGGSIQCISTFGKGARFEIEFPRNQQNS